MTDQKETRQVDIEVLNRAFESFNEVTRQLQSSYEKLQKRLQQMDVELAEKNQELEVNLKEKEEVKNYLNNIMESLSSGVIVVDEGNRITTFNPAAGTITGESPETSLGKILDEVFKPDLFTNMVSRLKQSRHPLITLERDFQWPDRGQLNVQISASPLSDPQGRQVGTVLVLQDITELKKLEEEAQRNRRLRAMGEMAAGIAHEIRNPLGGIELCASLLRKDLKDEPEKKQLAENICNGVNNMDRIISSILLFAKSPKPSNQKCEINGLLKELLDSPELSIHDKIKVTRNFAPGGIVGNADRDLLKQVFLNLIRNALQAMPEEGELCLTTQSSIQGEDPDPQSYPGRRWITITVSDTGEGIRQENQLKVFNPFFTTRDKGTGLGLAISHNIIKAHQGTIDVESPPGKGTAFIVKIPSWDTSTDEK